MSIFAAFVRRYAYYLAVAILAVLAHQQFAIDVPGDSLSEFLRRNSEALALMVLIPVYWDFVVCATPPGKSSGSRRIVWYGFLITGVAVLQFGELRSGLGLVLPDSFITLGESFVAAFVISVYFEWSRDARGVRRRSRLAISAYYLAVVAATILASQLFVRTLVGEPTAEWLSVNAEAFVAMALIPFYFDFVAAVFSCQGTMPRVRRSDWVNRGFWYGFLIVFPLFIQTDLAGVVLGNALAGWMTQTTEAFIAALGVSLYFDFVRPWSRRGADR